MKSLMLILPLVDLGVTDLCGLPTLLAKPRCVSRVCIHAPDEVDLYHSLYLDAAQFCTENLLDQFFCLVVDILSFVLV